MTYEPTIISRADWGAVAGKRALVRSRSGVWFVGHHTVGNVDQALDDPYQAVRDVQQLHLHDQVNDYSDIAYNWLVSPGGVIFEGRGWFRNGANGSGFNDDITNENSTSVALLGRGDDPRCFTPEARLAISWLMHAHLFLFKEGRPAGHRDKEHTACPGDLYYEWLHGGMSVPVDDDGQPLPDHQPPVPTDLEALLAQLRDLRLGDTGTDVRNLQALLNVRGAGLAVEGEFDEPTRTAVEGFMRDRDHHNLDGSVDDHASKYVWESLLTDPF